MILPLSITAGLRMFARIFLYLVRVPALVRESFPEEVAVLLDFVQICPLFTNCLCWVNLGMGREGETPAQIFWLIGVQKKSYKFSKLGRGGSR